MEGLGGEVPEAVDVASGVANREYLGPLRLASVFYAQLQFEGVYWERGEDWDYTAAELQGSFYYKSPKILQWFSGNIGFHRIYHLSARIPNYNLELQDYAEDWVKRELQGFSD